MRVSDNSVISSEPDISATPMRMRDGTVEGTGQYSCQLSADGSTRHGSSVRQSGMQLGRAALALVVLLLPAADARMDACDCIRLPPLSAAVRKEAPFIFEGKVVETVER